MMGEHIGEEAGPSANVRSDSAAQLRREAAKARTLADAAFSEEERRQLGEVAVTLEREASAIERAFSHRAEFSPRRPGEL